MSTAEDEVWDAGAFDPEWPDVEYRLDTQDPSPEKDLVLDAAFLEESESEEEYAPDSEEVTEDEEEKSPLKRRATMITKVSTLR